MSHVKRYFTRHVDIIRPDQKNYTCGQVNKVAIEEALFGPFEETRLWRVRGSGYN